MREKEGRRGIKNYQICLHMGVVGKSSRGLKVFSVQSMRELIKGLNREEPKVREIAINKCRKHLQVFPLVYYLIFFLFN